MLLTIDPELASICDVIVKKNKTKAEWHSIESSDMFQTENYNGGYDATENEFCFSYYTNENEYWFQISLEDVKKINEGLLTEINIRLADN